MKGVALVSGFIVFSAALNVLARRWRVPHPVLLVLGGAALAFVPGLPELPLDPDLVFVLFVPPLLYYGTAFHGSFRDFRSELWPIARLGVLLVLFTIGAVAWAAHRLTPEFTWPAAFALAAVVSPPDPVAASAVMRSLSVPSNLVSILEGEGLVNDATALVAYRVAVAAAVTGTFSAPAALIRLIVAGVGGVLIGLAAGWMIGWVRRLLVGLPVVENTVSLITPFASYLLADALSASGILAVVATGLYLARRGPSVIGAAARVQAEAMWSLIAFVLEGLVFMFVGLELPSALRSQTNHSLASLAWDGLAISAVVIGVRIAWVFPSAYLPRLAWNHLRRSADRRRDLPPWQWVVVVGWAGIRGAESLVIALSLPFVTAAGARFPARDLILFLTFVVIFATLVIQGLTLGPLLRALGVGRDERGATEEAHARRVSAEAGLRRLDQLSSDNGVHPDTARLLRSIHERLARQWTAQDRARHGLRDDEHRALESVSEDGVERESSTYRRLRMEMIGAERRAVIDLRNQGVIGDDVLRRIQRDLDLETMMLDAAGEGTQTSPYDAE